MIKALSIFIVLNLVSPIAFAQKKLDLDDLKIKGELLNDNRLRILAREKGSLKNYVKFRTNFRKEIIEGIPKPLPKLKY